MEFFYVGTDGKHEPHIVPGVLAQTAQVFAELEAQVLQAADVPLFVFNDAGFEPTSDEEPMGQCLSCQCPMDTMCIDEHGICGDCNSRAIMDVLRTPLFARTDEDWATLRALGYVEDDVYDADDEYAN